MPNPNAPLRLNVGFLINQNIGYSREFPFDVPRIQFPPDLVLTNLAGTARFTRTPQGLLSQVKLQANCACECVRCLSSFLQPLEVEYTELYAFSKRTVSETGLLLPEDGYVNLQPLVREYMLLEIPIKPLCRPNCKGLCLVCGTNLNETPCEHGASQADSNV